MKSPSRKITAYMIVLVFTAVMFPGSALAQDDTHITQEISAHAMAWDVFFVRPLGVASIVICSGVFVIAWPFAALSGNTEAAYQKLIVNPVTFTFGRELGDF